MPAIQKNDQPLPSWRDGASRQAILEFVSKVTTAGGRDFVPQEDRVAVFDNDGTLWCEKPMPIELDFILRRLVEMAEENAELRERQPWRAAVTGDHGWLGKAITKHYHGDGSDVKLLLAAILQAFAGWSVEKYQAAADRFLHSARHPTLGRPYTACGYAPMVELLDFLASHGFTSYIASGGDRDFMRPITQELYGISSERIIGSSNALRYEEGENGGSIVYLAEPDVFDDGDVKPVRVWSRIGRRPILAAGNANGDLHMLKFAGGPNRPALRLLLLHDDQRREFSYVAGAERILAEAKAEDWTMGSFNADWAQVFERSPVTNKSGHR